MASTILLDQTNWDLLLDADGNIARADEPYSLAQDAASAIKTFLGECYWDTTIGVPYNSDILAKNPSIALLKQDLADAALTVPGVSAAKCFLQNLTDRVLSGQVQVTSASTGQVAAVPFSTVNPQGA